MVLNFTARLREVQADKQSRLCVGLDPDPQRLPPHLLDTQPLADAVIAFNAAIIDATAPLACAFKLNLAFYEALAAEGWRALEATLRHVPTDVLTIADGKRGDIGNSARFYADALFDTLDVDACTVAPYMGRDAVEPFLSYDGKAAFVLARTSNPGAGNFQEQTCDGEPLYAHVARRVADWDADAAGTAGLVVGATDLDALRHLRQVCPTLPFLIPGVGAQGGDPDAVIAAAATDDGPVLVNSSRSILYASSGTDFAEAAAREADDLRRRLLGGME
jgi:orotidine-5'-phosphate decarboxylase